MQRFLLSLLIILSSSRMFAQSIEDIEAQLQKGELDKAKVTVDAFLAKEKNQSKADGWWYKGVVYNQIAKSDKYKNLVADGRMEAFIAFKKYYEVDPKAIRGTLEQHVRLFDIYKDYFDLGVTSFGQSNFEDAYNNFKNALTVEEYVAGKGFEYNGFKFSGFDTTLTRNIALSASRAKKDEEAVVYLKKIADQKIGGEDFISIYLELIEYYGKKKDKANREKYILLGRELYPKDDNWYLLELDEVDEKDKKALFAKYEELMPKYPDKHIMMYNYAVELFNYTYASDPKPADYRESQKKIESVLKTAIAANKSYPEANVLMARHFYNVLYDYQDEMQAIKGITEADKKKKADLKTKMNESADQLILYSQAALDLYSAKPTLKAGEKGNFKVVAGYLSTAYDIKGDKAKADEYRKKAEAGN